MFRMASSIHGLFPAMYIMLQLYQLCIDCKRNKKTKRQTALHSSIKVVTSLNYFKY